jgi:hypothetical protein
MVLKVVPSCKGVIRSALAYARRGEIYATNAEMPCPKSLTELLISGQQLDSLFKLSFGRLRNLKIVGS